MWALLLILLDVFLLYFTINIICRVPVPKKYEDMHVCVPNSEIIRVSNRPYPIWSNMEFIGITWSMFYILLINFFMCVSLRKEIKMKCLDSSYIIDCPFTSFYGFELATMMKPVTMTVLLILLLRLASMKKTQRVLSNC